MNLEKRMAPAGNQGHSGDHHHDHLAELPASSSLPEIDPRGMVDGVHVVVVHSKDSAGNSRWTRRLYLSLHSAERALSRARMRGDDAYMVLCQLRAVEARGGGVL